MGKERGSDIPRERTDGRTSEGKHERTNERTQTHMDTENTREDAKDTYEGKNEI